MRKLTVILTVILLLFSVAAAETVTQEDDELMLLDEPFIGKYTGEMENGLPEGYGIFVTSNPAGRNWHYIGYWEKGLMHGEGATYWEDGSLEIGTYREGRLIFGYFNYDGVKLELFSEGSGQSGRTLSDGSSAPVVLFVGSKLSKIYHAPDCDLVPDIKEKDRVEFFTRTEAQTAGYIPCQKCGP